mmetsp:Transcript_90806/g.203201  ORF Transcript_90806/g.203201 Transcript_90806/m.203201 type:complete len:236 (-) Transcript_90806:863-1570(-)
MSSTAARRRIRSLGVASLLADRRAWTVPWCRRRSRPSLSRTRQRRLPSSQRPPLAQHVAEGAAEVAAGGRSARAASAVRSASRGSRASRGMPRSLASPRPRPSETPRSPPRPRPWPKSRWGRRRRSSTWSPCSTTWLSIGRSSSGRSCSTRRRRPLRRHRSRGSRRHRSRRHLRLPQRSPATALTRQARMPPRKRMQTPSWCSVAPSTSSVRMSHGTSTTSCRSRVSKSPSAPSR